MDEDIDYVETKYYFHTFEGHDNKMAFSFASADEAKVFKRRVEEKVRFKRRAEERTATRGRVAEAGIGSPTDFKQITHVSLDPVSGFVVDTVEHDVKCVFQKAGIEQPPDKSKQELRNRETDEMRLGRGGPSSNERRFRRVIARPRSPPPPVPAMKKSSPPVYGSSSPIYEPPPSIYELPPSLPPVDYPRNRASLRKSLSSRALPATPAKRCASVESIKSKSSICRPSCPPPPPPVSSNPRSTSPPPPPSIPRPPPPVFLPPPPPTSPPPPVSPSSKQCPSSSSACRTMSASLLESIKTGVALKAVPKKEASPLDLLGDIRKGIKLKPVGEREEKPCKVSSRPDMLEALSKVLAARSAKIHSEDDADDESTSNDEAWQEGE